LKTQVYSSFFLNEKTLSQSKSSIGVKSLLFQWRLARKRKVKISTIAPCVDVWHGVLVTKISVDLPKMT
jgi:hypothetical protein